MALGRRKRNQQDLWVATCDLPKSPGHPFYSKLNGLLGEAEFDEFVVQLAEKRDEIYNAFESRKLQLTERRNKRATSLAAAADRILTPSKGNLSKQADAYIDQLIAERAMGGPPVNVESFTSRPMRDGIDMEPEARRRYELVEGVDVEALR